MLRKMIKIDREKCNGCGLCVNACHEGAIVLNNGKAELLRDDYCDGLGDCLPVCPTGAISFEMREALAYDKQAVERASKGKAEPLACGCPGSQSKALKREQHTDFHNKVNCESELSQWPVQIKLVPVNAPCFSGAKLLIAADCTAFAYGNFHSEFIRDHVTLIGCPKLDEGDYAEKLGEILKQNSIESICVVRMEVPCCRGIEQAVKQAVKNSGKTLPCQIKVISTDGHLIEG